MADKRRVRFDAAERPKATPKRKQPWSRRHRRELAPLYLAGAVLFTGWLAPTVDGIVKWILLGALVLAAAAALLTRSWVDRKRERAVVIAGVLAVALWLLSASQWGITTPILYAWAGLSLLGAVLWWTDWFQTAKTRKTKTKAEKRTPQVGGGAWYTDAGLTAAFDEAGLLRPGRDGEPAPTPRAIGRPDVDDFGTTVRVRLPRGIGYSKVESSREALAAALDQPSRLVTVSQLRTDPAGVARIRVSLPYERTIRTHALPEVSSWRDPVTIGRDRRGRDVQFQTYDIGQVLVGGRTGSGKTHFLRLLTSHYALDPNADVYIVDGKGSTDDWGPIRSRCKRLLFIHDADPAEKFKDLIEHVQDVVTERNLRGGRDHPGTLVVLEEFSSMLASLDPTEKKDMERKVTRLTQTCRSANVMVVIAAQRPSASSMSTDTRAQAAVSVALAMKSNTDITMVLGHTPTMELPNEPGEAIVVVPGREDVFVDLDTIPDGDWEDLCAQWAPPLVPSEPRALPQATQPPLVDDFAYLDAEPIEHAQPIPIESAYIKYGDIETGDAAEAVQLITTAQYATRQMVSRKLRIGWAAAGAIMEGLEAAGVIGPEREDGTHEVLAESAPESPVADLDVRESPETENEPETGAQEPESAPPVTTADAVMHYMAEHPGEVAASSIVLALQPRSRSAVKQALTKLVADGVLTKPRHGYYATKETTP